MFLPPHPLAVPVLTSRAPGCKHLCAALGPAFPGISVIFGHGGAGGAAGPSSAAPGLQCMAKPGQALESCWSFGRALPWDQPSLPTSHSSQLICLITWQLHPARGHRTNQVCPGSSDGVLGNLVLSALGTGSGLGALLALQSSGCWALLNDPLWSIPARTAWEVRWEVRCELPDPQPGQHSQPCGCSLLITPLSHYS